MRSTVSASLSALILFLLVVTSFTGAVSTPWQKKQEDDPQVTLAVDPRVIMGAAASGGLGDNPDPGTSPSATSLNNFVNFCLTQDVPITNGQQIPGGSCNPAPLGRLVARNKQPSCKFVFPPNMDSSLLSNQTFTIEMKIHNLDTGWFTNPATTYFMAPQTVNGEGLIQGHSHVVIQKLDSITQIDPIDPQQFVYFKGLNHKADDGILRTEVPGGLEAGDYRMCSINSSTNHQPVLVSNAQHGSTDDCIYFTVRSSDTPEVQAAKEAQRLNRSYQNITAGDDCETGDYCTKEGGFAQCVNGAIVSLGCALSTECFAYPSGENVELACTFEETVVEAMEAVGVHGGVRG